MQWKRALNAGLARATGYTLVRADRLGPQPPPRPERPRRRRGPTPFDEEARETIRSVKPRTMTAPEKLYGLILATRYVVDHAIPGSIVECGVWRGGSMQAVARTLLARGVTDRDLHLFDTFEGMPPPTERDRRPDGKLAAEMLATRPKTRKVWAVANIDDVRAGMAENESTRHELEHLYDRVPSGGVLILDDYGFWQGARQAIDEFLDRTGERLLLSPIASGRITVKP
jgi:O-methyltransferase